MKAWISCSDCAFSDFQGVGEKGHGRCRIGRPRLIAPVQEMVRNALTQKVEQRTGTFAGWPPVRRADGCGEGRAEISS